MKASRTTSTATASIEVLVADDHAVVRRGIRQILEEARGIVVAGEASNARQVLELVRGGAGHVLVLDLVMPGAEGIELLETVRRHRSDLAVLILSMHPVEQYAVRVLQAGAAGYLTKETAADELVQAVRTVFGGRRYVTSQVAQHLAAHLDRGSDLPAYDRLSNREYQVLRLLGAAFSIRQIASKLHLSEKTVSTYRARLLDKIHVRNTAELIRYAVRNNLVD